MSIPNKCMKKKYLIFIFLFILVFALAFTNKISWEAASQNPIGGFITELLHTSNPQSTITSSSSVKMTPIQLSKGTIVFDYKNIVYAIDHEGAHFVELAQNFGESNMKIGRYHLSPDGTKAVYNLYENNKSSDPRSGLWLIDLTTRKKTQLLSAEYLFNYGVDVNWSPTGKYLSFANTEYMQDRSRRYRVRIIDAETGKEIWDTYSVNQDTDWQDGYRGKMSNVYFLTDDRISYVKNGNLIVENIDGTDRTVLDTEVSVEFVGDRGPNRHAIVWSPSLRFVRYIKYYSLDSKRFGFSSGEFETVIDTKTGKKDFLVGAAKDGYTFAEPGLFKEYAKEMGIAAAKPYVYLYTGDKLGIVSYADLTNGKFVLNEFGEYSRNENFLYPKIFVDAYTAFGFYQYYGSEEHGHFMTYPVLIDMQTPKMHNCNIAFDDSIFNYVINLPGFIGITGRREEENVILNLQTCMLQQNLPQEFIYGKIAYVIN
ncbi:hypothetical protein KC726_01135 [Candidatus Woesebacteria bacterium]|nr:hypothetical protein [Candidatus Woesebacteria bacterium]